MAEPTIAPALRPFVQQMLHFDPAVSLGIGPWLTPLLHVLGPMRVPTDSTSGDPDGYSGIARRGPYDRLLTSEWLFALDEPDEFIRRAVMDEHMFLARHFRDPSGASTSVALLDCGPLQLGAPRLAQLALLVVLARRAAAAGAVFRFGMLQVPGIVLGELERSTITEWSRTRSWAPADLHLEHWRGVLAEVAATDVWVVGAEGTRPVATALAANAVVIDEVAATALRVQTHRRDAVGAAITLALPDTQVSVAVLRNPLAKPALTNARRVATHSRGMGRLSLDGRRLLLPCADGSLDALHIPGSTREPVGKTKHIPVRERMRLVAADIFGGRPIAIYERGDELHLAGSGLVVGRTSPSAAASLGEIHTLAVDVKASQLCCAPDDVLQMQVLIANPTAFNAWIVGGDGQLWELSLGASTGERHLLEPKLEVRETECSNFTRQGPGAVAWISGSSRTVVTSAPHRVWELGEGDWPACVFGIVEGGKSPTFVYPRGDRHVVVRDGSVDVDAPDGRCFGLTWRYDAERRAHPQLLYVGRDDRTIRLDWAQDDELLATLPEVIAEIRYEPFSGKILYRTITGERGVYSMDRREIVWRGAPAAPR